MEKGYFTSFRELLLLLLLLLLLPPTHTFRRRKIPEANIFSLASYFSFYRKEREKRFSYNGFKHAALLSLLSLLIIAIFNRINCHLPLVSGKGSHCVSAVFFSNFLSLLSKQTEWISLSCLHAVVDSQSFYLSFFFPLPPPPLPLSMPNSHLPSLFHRTVGDTFTDTCKKTRAKFPK